MAGIYKSRYSGPQVDEALSRALLFDPTENGWIHLPSEKESPIVLSHLFSIGNFIVEHFIDTPDEISNLCPINISIFENNGKLIQSIPFLSKVYHREYNKQNLEYGEWKCTKATNTIFIDECPSSAEENSLSISKNENGDYVLKVFLNGKWTDVETPDVMLKSIYDPQNRDTDFFKYVDDHIAELTGSSDNKDNLEDILNHINNESIHFSNEDRELLKLKETKENTSVQINRTENELKNYADRITQKAIDDGAQLQSDFSDLEDDFTEHINNHTKHPTEEERAYWNAKAEPDHTHILDNRVKIHANQVVGGKFDLSLIPEGAKELLTRVDSIEERNLLTIQDVQNGDRIGVNSEGIWEVIDETKLAHIDPDTGDVIPADESAFYECSAGSGVFIHWKNVENTPNSIHGYGIGDTYTKQEFDDLMRELIAQETERLEDRYSTYNLDDLYEVTYDTKKNVDQIQSEIEDAISITQDVRQLEIKVKEQNERMVMMSENLTEAQLIVENLLRLFL